MSVGPAWHVRLAGALDASTVEELDAALNHPGLIVVDCSELTFMDSAGVAALLRANERACDKGYRLVVTGLSGGPLRVAQQARLDELLRGDRL